MRTIFSTLQFLTITLLFISLTQITAQRQDNYDLNIGDGKGLRFWNGSDYYKIHMGTGNDYKFGPVQDYSIKTNMYGANNRGFTWGENGKTPIAGLNLQGHFEIAGDFSSKNSNVNGGNLFLNAPVGSGNGPNFYNQGLYFKNGSSTVYSISYGVYPAPGNGELNFRGRTFNFRTTDKVTFTGGDVSIGASYSRGKKLYVNGDSHITGNLDIDNGLNINESKDLKFIADDNDAGDVIFEKNNGNQMGRIWTNDSNGGRLHLSSKDNNADLTIDYRGYVGIGTLDPKNKLSVNGHIWAKEIKVKLTDGADWVFEEDYNLKPLEEVEAFIKTYKHLPEIPSADDFRANDMKVSEMTNKLLQKIEELTLYTIAQEKLLQLQAEKNKALEARLAKLELLLKK